MLDRPRHGDLMKEIRAAGARMKLISDGDVAGGIQAAMPDSGVDVLMGIGGTPEGVITAAAIRCTGGEILCKPWPRDEAERQKALDAGVDLNHIYWTEELSPAKTSSSPRRRQHRRAARGVNTTSTGATTQSLVMRSQSGTIRWMDSDHDFSRLNKVRFVE